MLYSDHEEEVCSLLWPALNTEVSVGLKVPILAWKEDPGMKGRAC